MLDLDLIRVAPVDLDPFPHFYLQQVLDSDSASALVNEFPELRHGGSYNVDDVSLSPRIKHFLDDFDSPEFRQIIGDKFGIDVQQLPMMATLRGYSRAKDGRIHTDSKSKVITILVYLNDSWEPKTGRLRLLRGGTDMDDYVTELLPGCASMLVFKVTDNCWHGYRSFEGKRQSIQINYLTGEAAGTKHRLLHKLSARLKNLFH